MLRRIPLRFAAPVGSCGHTCRRACGVAPLLIFFPRREGPRERETAA